MNYNWERFNICNKRRSLRTKIYAHAAGTGRGIIRNDVQSNKYNLIFKIDKDTKNIRVAFDPGARATGERGRLSRTGLNQFPSG